MAKQLDPRIAETLKKYGATKDDLWDCHGTWVVYHAALERVAAVAGILFAPPMVLEADGDKRCVALCVTGELGGRAEWSIGEASPHNYIVKGKMQAYPYAMAEKRGKDRVILKLIGLHGMIYSEEEADDFKSGGPPPEPAVDQVKNPAGRRKAVTSVRDADREIRSCDDSDTLLALINTKEFMELALKTCVEFPNDWIGPEDNSGLSGALAQRGVELGCMDQTDLYITRCERKRDEINKKGATT